jgi:mono/diheme cytochrome c family protein
MRALPAAFFLGALGLGAATLSLAGFGRAHAQDASPSTHGSGQVAEGQRVWRRANCMGCHKWHGDGGGGYGGDALSLRATKLDRDQIIETVTCGRPGTGMPYFVRGVYDGDAHQCYGASREDLGKNIPMEAPATFLRPNEIAAVADYVIADVKGKGKPTLAECLAFFGDGSRVCNVYKTEKPDEPASAGGGQPGKEGG